MKRSFHSPFGGARAGHWAVWERCAKAPVPSLRAGEALQEFLSLLQEEGTLCSLAGSLTAAQVPELCLLSWDVAVHSVRQSVEGRRWFPRLPPRFRRCQENPSYAALRGQICTPWKSCSVMRVQENEKENECVFFYFKKISSILSLLLNL